MNEAAFAKDAAAQSAQSTDKTTEHAAAEPRAFAVVQDAWRRNLEAGAQTARALQAQNADFATRLFDLNLQAARSFGEAAAGKDGYSKSLELGASAVELCFDYLGRSATLAQQAIMLPWTQGKVRS
jgi:hypothetical protein